MCGIPRLSSALSSYCHDHFVKRGVPTKETKIFERKSHRVIERTEGKPIDSAQRGKAVDVPREGANRRCMKGNLVDAARFDMYSIYAVSYTHLDVYKRQGQRVLDFFMTSVIAL